VVSLERFRPHTPLLWTLALAGLLGINTAFLYGAVLRPEHVAPALTNPIALAFVVEALVLTAFGAWVVWLLGFRRPGPVTFVVLSLVGSLAFSVPLLILMHLRKRVRGHGPAA
jgi:hypothetical protein